MGRRRSAYRVGRVREASSGEPETLGDALAERLAARLVRGPPAARARDRSTAAPNDGGHEAGLFGDPRYPARPTGTGIRGSGSGNSLLRPPDGPLPSRLPLSRGRPSDAR